MPTLVPHLYLSGVTDEELNRIIKELSQEIIQSSGNINIVMRFAPIIQLGQNELQKRILDQATRNSEKTEKIAIIVAVLSVLTAIVFSVVTLVSDSYGQKQQSTSMYNIENALKDIQQKIEVSPPSIR